LTEDTLEHLEYILEKERKTIKKFGIDNLGHSRGNFSDFDDEKPIPMSKESTPKPKKKIEKIEKRKPIKRSDRWFPRSRVQD